MFMGIVFLTATGFWQEAAVPYQKVGDAVRTGLDTLLGEDREKLFERWAEAVEEGENVPEAENGAMGSISPEEQEKDVSGETEEVAGMESGADGAEGSAGENSSAEENGTGEGESVDSSEPPKPIEFGQVEDEYFADALFIGDSRTVGLYEYAGLENIATFYASTGLTVYKMFDSPIVKVPGQIQKQTIEEALQEKQFAKIYLMIGINEMGTGTVETFMAKYKEAVEHLKEMQPDAIIYLQAIIKVTTKRSEQGDYINNEGIEARNAEIAKLADGQKVFFLDVNPLICDETGGMNPSYTFDGVHLEARYIPIWKDFLKQNAVVLD